jgi:DNA-binding SARP family transcriptional activator
VSAPASVVHHEAIDATRGAYVNGAATGPDLWWFQVLGPLHLFHHGQPVRLGGVKQRAAMGFLLLRANQFVPTSDLMRALWPEAAPPTARKVLQNAVSGLRRTIGGGDGEVALSSHASGYALRVRPDCLDLSRFQRLAERGRQELAAGSYEPAIRSLRTALALWQGTVLADLTESGVAWPELAGIESARMAVLEDCFEAELACGRHHVVTAELEALVDRVPTRERLCGQLMVALYRSGRQVDALGLYRRTRAGMLEGFGLEPGRELQRLERAILNHDPALVAPAPESAVALLPGPPHRESELTVVREVLELTRQRRRAHLVTVLGGPGAGKSRLVSDLCDLLNDRPDVRYLLGPTHDDGRGRPAVECRPSGAPRRFAGPGEMWQRMLPHLLELRRAGHDRFATWRTVVERVAAERPLVMVFEDLDRADEEFLDLLDGLVRTAGRVPLLVVATARPEFARRRTSWGGGGLNATTITLDPARILAA